MAYQSEIEKLTRLWNDKPEQYFAPLAEAYRKVGEIDLAIDVLRSGLEKRPNYLSAHIVLGRCLFDQKNDGEAGKVFEQVLGLDSENIIALKALSEIAQRTADTAGAQQWLKRLLEVDPMNEDAQQALDRVNAMLGAEVSPPPAAMAPPVEATDDTGSGTSLLEGLESTSLAAAPSAWEAPVVEPVTPPVDPEAATLQVPAGDPGHGIRDEPVAPEPPAFESLALDRVAAEFDEDLPGAEIEPIQTGRSADAEPDVPFELGSPHAELSGGSASPGQEFSLDALGNEPAPVEGPPAEASEAPVAGSVAAEAESDAAWAADTVGEVSFELTGAAASAAEDEVDSTGGVEGLETSRSAALPVFAAEGPETSEEPSALAGDVPELPTDLPELPAETTALAGDGDGTSPRPRRPSQDLPFILPDEVPESEPEPVITETMAEVYAKQGLLAEAREVYRKLLARRPGDSSLMARLAELERSDAGRSGTRPARLSAAFTGGMSARAFLVTILSARPAGEPAESQADVPAPGSTLERAFGDADDDPLGAPTGPAADEMSLASVFGDDGGTTRAVPALPATAAGPAAAPPRPAAPGGSSFDEFFGVKKAGESSSKPSARVSNPPATPAADSADDDEFRAWLKGLKS